ncbi:R.CviAII restriction endonuclease [Paramecium bursaria Chlorella virus 1]|uniref:Type II restriction enzyme CviAII n=1 Tax=Paramecium bursaria Chlorella virus 1 TaxID=10506 RepID=T2C2_PBCV1|nr:R.CviAII restriction endonuclease [Paramecium bursaria Chlorella virus 1]AAC97063.2 R.CviAII restriction endonuclease [Paramecium bursaria Chlorella virus 1]
MTQKILNPVTGRFVKVDGSTGKKIKTGNIYDVNNILSSKLTKKIFDKIRRNDLAKEERETQQLTKKISKGIFDKIRSENKKYEKNTQKLTKKMVLDIFSKIYKEDSRKSKTQCVVSEKKDNGGVLLTEDLGKIFEKSICMLYDTPYIGPYKYGNEKPMLLKTRLTKLLDFFPELTHTAAGGALHDFTTKNSRYLSAKTSKKKDGKVAPQKIGQPTKKKFLEFFNLPPDTSNDDIKLFIKKNIVRILDEYFKYTFDDTIIYYNEVNNIIMLVKTLKKVKFDPNLIEFGCNKPGKSWKESTILFYNNKRLGEFQIHTSRSCIKFRWFFENILLLFPDNFEVTIL